MPFTEFTMSVNEFQEPKVLEDADAVMLLLTRLLLLEPGTLPANPDAGVGLFSKYRYASEDDARKLETEYQKQIQTWLPQFQGVKVTVKYEPSDRSYRIDFMVYTITSETSR